MRTQHILECLNPDSSNLLRKHCAIAFCNTKQKHPSHRQMLGMKVFHFQWIKSVVTVDKQKPTNSNLKVLPVPAVPSQLLSARVANGDTVADACAAVAAQVRENIKLRRGFRVESTGETGDDSSPQNLCTSSFFGFPVSLQHTFASQIAVSISFCTQDHKVKGRVREDRAGRTCTYELAPTNPWCDPVYYISDLEA